MSKKYAGVEDLLSNESFLSWYFRTDTYDIRHWEAWMAENPDHRSRADQAVAFLKTLSFDERELSAGQMTLAERRLLQKIHDAGSKPGNPGRTPLRSIIPISARRRWTIAASILLVAAGLYTFRVLSTRAVPELHTTFGEVAENRLPDGTRVVVNADSRLVLSPGWKDGKDREVWLTGEAFFHVTKTPLKSRFIVHANHFDIIVTGTQFNVVNRNGRANVTLKEGSVILRTEDGKELKMAPGDFVEYRSATFEKVVAKTDSVIAWKDHKLVFNDTPLKDVIGVIREHYGVTVITTGASTEGKTVSGIQPNDNLDLLLQSLEATGEYDIRRQEDTITINIRIHP
jgi:ferric-dicitrate binding protein FerR (iron transport regulator)